MLELLPHQVALAGVWLLAFVFSFFPIYDYGRAGAGPSVWTGIDWLLDQQVLVWPGEGSDLLCAARDPLLPSLREALRHAFPGRKVHWCLCRAQDLERTLDGLAHHARADDWALPRSGRPLA